MPHYTEQQQNLIDILGFDPNTGKTVDLSQNSLQNGFSSQANRPTLALSDILEHPAFENTFFAKTIGYGNPRHICLPSSLFTVIDDGYKNVTRRYHDIDPTLPLDQQKFPISNYTVFERVSRWGDFAKGELYRLLRLGITDPQNDLSQTVEFSTGDEVVINLRGGEWGNTTFIYEIGKLKSGKTSHPDYFKKEDFFDATTPTSILQGPTHNFYIPSNLTHPHPTELFVRDFSLEENPFDAKPSLDNTWKGQDIASAFEIRAVEKEN